MSHNTECPKDTAFDLALPDLKPGGPIDGQRVLEAICWRWPSPVVIKLTAHRRLEMAVDAIQEAVVHPSPAAQGGARAGEPTVHPRCARRGVSLCRIDGR